MFIRQCSRLIKGKRQSYWALVESYRTARGPRQRVVAWLGKLDAAGRLGVLQAAESSERDSLHQNGSASAKQNTLFDEAESAPEPRWVEVNAAGVRVENCRQFGGPWLALELIGRLQLDEFLRREIAPGQEHVPWSLSALILVIARLLEPSSEDAGGVGGVGGDRGSGTYPLMPTQAAYMSLGERSRPSPRYGSAPHADGSASTRPQGGVGTLRALGLPVRPTPPGRPRAWLHAGPGVACKSLALPALHSPTLSYMVASPSPSSARFEPRVFERLSTFVAAHRDLTLSSAISRLVDEALRIREHPLITFRDGPAGRRARLVGGPDVWEVIGAIRSVREAEPALAGDEVLEVVAETSGTPVPFMRAALAYWSDYPEEVEDFLDRARAEAA